MFGRRSDAARVQTLLWRRNLAVGRRDDVLNQTQLGSDRLCVRPRHGLLEAGPEHAEIVYQSLFVSTHACVPACLPSLLTSDGGIITAACYGHAEHACRCIGLLMPDDVELGGLTAKAGETVR